MKKILKNYGGAILLYIVLFLGIIAINTKFNSLDTANVKEYETIALNNK